MPRLFCKQFYVIRYSLLIRNMLIFFSLMSYVKRSSHLMEYKRFYNVSRQILDTLTITRGTENELLFKSVVCHPVISLLAFISKPAAVRNFTVGIGMIKTQAIKPPLELCSTSYIKDILSHGSDVWRIDVTLTPISVCITFWRVSVTMFAKILTKNRIIYMYIYTEQ